MLLIMGGATLSAAGSFRGSVTVPQGLNFVVGDVMSPSGFLSTPTEAFSTEVHVNRFYMDYYDSGEVSFEKKSNYLFFFFSYVCNSCLIYILRFTLFFFLPIKLSRF